MLRSLFQRARPQARPSSLNTSLRCAPPLRNWIAGSRIAECRVPGRSLATVVEGIHREPTELDNITRLPNGLRVATEALPGAFSAVGVYVDAGSRYEPPSLHGASHIVDRLAFKTTLTQSAEAVLARVEALGGEIQCISSRESIMYSVVTFNSAVPEALALLADTIRYPRIDGELVRAQLAAAEYETTEIWNKPELVMPELLHMAAYRDNTLGNPLLCPHDRIAVTNADTINRYRDLLYRPERIVVAFAGVDHATAVRLTEQYFGDMTASGPPLRTASLVQLADSADSTTDSTNTSVTSASTSASASSASAAAAASSSFQPSRILSKVPFFKNLSTSAPRSATVASPDDLAVAFAPSHYTGGIFYVPPSASKQPQNPNYPSFTHLYVAFEGLPISSPDIYALAALQTLLGGGGSFSTGGPGKGMYSRLYTNVLSQHGWVDSCAAFNHSYTDSGLFGVSTSCHPQRVSSVVDVVCSELRALTAEGGFRALRKIEVDRAKNQLRSGLLMNLESRVVELEDLGRQVQVNGRKIPVREMCERIEALRPDDLARVATEVLCGKIQNVGQGSGAPTLAIMPANAAETETDSVPLQGIQAAIYSAGLGRR